MTCSCFVAAVASISKNGNMVFWFVRRAPKSSPIGDIGTQGDIGVVQRDNASGYLSSLRNKNKISQTFFLFISNYGILEILT